MILGDEETCEEEGCEKEVSCTAKAIGGSSIEEPPGYMIFLPQESDLRQDTRGFKRFAGGSGHTPAFGMSHQIGHELGVQSVSGFVG